MEYLQYCKNHNEEIWKRAKVLNLIINGIPSIPRPRIYSFIFKIFVLNLIINGIPSILDCYDIVGVRFPSFKPYYKWNTFNTVGEYIDVKKELVLNLIINGIPSIHI